MGYPACRRQGEQAPPQFFPGAGPDGPAPGKNYYTVVRVVYKQFPGSRGELQGGFSGCFNLFIGQFSFNFPNEFPLNS